MKIRGIFPLIDNIGFLCGGGTILEHENTIYSSKASLFVPINQFTVMQEICLPLMKLVIVYIASSVNPIQIAFRRRLIRTHLV